MTQEGNLLLQDLCARLPYGVKINCFDVPRTLESISIDYDGFITIDCGGEHFYHPFSNILHKDCLPYLRPMSSMTEEEEMEYDATFATIKYADGHYDSTMAYKSFDYLNKNHFDYRGLIEKGLAIAVTKENNPYKD